MSLPSSTASEPVWPDNIPWDGLSQYPELKEAAACQSPVHYPTEHLAATGPLLGIQATIQLIQATFRDAYALQKAGKTQESAAALAGIAPKIQALPDDSPNGIPFKQIYQKCVAKLTAAIASSGFAQEYALIPKIIPPSEIDRTTTYGFVDDTRVPWTL